MKTAIILDSDSNSTHPMEGVLDRRGFVILRAGSIEETIALMSGSGASIDLVILEVPLSGSASQTEAAARIQKSFGEIPILLISELSLDKWSEDDFQRFGSLQSGRVDLLVKPLSQGSFMAKANALIYTVSYVDSKRLFETSAARRVEAARIERGASALAG